MPLVSLAIPPHHPQGLIASSRTETSSLVPAGTQSSSGAATPTATPDSVSLVAASLTDRGMLVVADSIPPVSFSVTLSRCPGTALASAAFAGVSCAPVPSSSASFGSYLSTYVADARGVGSLSCLSDGSPPPLLASVVASVRFRAAAVTGTLALGLVPGDSSTSDVSGEVPVVVHATLWPLWDDAIVVAADGTLRSSVFGPVNGTRALIASLSACTNASASPSCSISAALAQPSAILSATVASFGGMALPTAASLAASPVSSFELTFADSASLVLRSDLPAFDSGIAVAMGGVACSRVTVTPDGRWLFAQTPSSAAVCGSGGECGNVAISLTNPQRGGEDSSRRRAAVAWEPHKGTQGRSITAVDTPLQLGATLSCPPFCPGFIASGGIPVPVALGGNASDVSFLPGVGPSGGDNGSDSSAPTLLGTATFATTSSGLYLSGFCTGATAETGAFTDPTTGVCSNASDPASARCAYGSGAACIPVGAPFLLSMAWLAGNALHIPSKRSVRSVRCVLAAHARGLFRVTFRPRRACRT